MFMRQPVARANEYFPQGHGPAGGLCHGAFLHLAANTHIPPAPQGASMGYSAAIFRARRFSAWAKAASRTQAPSSQALRRALIRSRAMGPLPLTTAQNSSQSM